MWDSKGWFLLANGRTHGILDGAVTGDALFYHVRDLPHGGIRAIHVPVPQ
jgi:hypothetical protein